MATKQDFIDKGRAAFVNGGSMSMSTPMSWQEKAFHEGWMAAQAEASPKPVVRKAEVISGWAMSRRARDAAKRTAAFQKKFEWHKRIRQCAKETANLEKRSRGFRGSVISNSIRRSAD